MKTEAKPITNLFTFSARIYSLKSAIADAYLRMATNTDPSYRKEQEYKVQGWLAEMAELIQSNPELYVEYAAPESNALFKTMQARQLELTEQCVADYLNRYDTTLNEVHRKELESFLKELRINL